MQRSYQTTCILLLAAGVLAQPAPADPSPDNCRSASADCVAVGHWNFSVSLGAGVRTNPLAQRSDIPLIVIPQFSYYGERFFVDNLDIGYALIERPAYSLNLFASPDYDRVFFSLHDPQNIFGSTSGTGTNNAPPPAERSIDFTYLAGLEWMQKYRSADIQLDLLHEITGHNDGNEVRAALGVPLWRSTSTITADVGFTWKSSAIVNYYYGVPGIYRGGSALNPFIKFAYERPISAHWKMKAFLHGERLGDAIASSPIVAQRYVITTFAGATYAF